MKLVKLLERLKQVHRYQNKRQHKFRPIMFNVNFVNEILTNMQLNDTFLCKIIEAKKKEEE